MACTASLLTGFIVAIQIVFLLGKAEIPKVLLIRDGHYVNSSNNNPANITLTEAQKEKLQISCISNFPNRWMWENTENPKMATTAKERQTLRSDIKISKFVSNLTIDLNTDDNPVETNYSCSIGMNFTGNKWLDHSVTCVEIYSLGNEPLHLLIHSGISLIKCLGLPEPALENNNRICTEDLTIDLEKARGTCKKQSYKTNMKAKQCKDLDSCENPDFSFKYDRNGICKQGTFKRIPNSSNMTIPLKNLTESPFLFPLQVFCEITFDSTWSSFLAVYPSVNENWEFSLYQKTVEDARERNSVDIVALQPEQSSFNKINDWNRRKQFAIGETVTFVCVAVKYLYMSGFQWKINDKYDFGDSDEKIDDKVSLMIKNSNLTEYLHLVPKNVCMNDTKYGHSFAVTCEAPIWNSEEYFPKTINVSLFRKITIRAVPPRTTELFCVKKNYNDTTINCSCQYSGWPKPIIYWNAPQNSSIDDSVIEVSNKSVNPHQKLWTTSKKFIIVKPPFDITCTAKNFVGNDSRKYNYRLELENELESNKTLYIIISISLLAVFILAVVMAIMYWRYRKKLEVYIERQNNLTVEEIDEFYSGASLTSSTCDALLLPYNSEYEIPKEELSMNDTILGSGQFGFVFKGMIGPLPVAVKTIKQTADIIYFKSLLTELKILQYIGPHRNIVNLVGANTANIRRREVYLILDFCSNGSLVEFLRKNRQKFVDFFNECTSKEDKYPEYENARDVVLTTGNLIGFATEVASALDHLASKNVIHGDLAARNVLVTEDLHAKICDFGLSKQLLHYTVYVQKIDCPLPLRWMALESLQDMEFSLASDKWSYGIVLWETFSLGELPYPGEQWSFASYQRLQEGYRMAKPKYASDEIYRLMLECWNSEPQERPSFQYIMSKLKKEEEMLI